MKEDSRNQIPEASSTEATGSVWVPVLWLAIPFVLVLLWEVFAGA